MRENQRGILSPELALIVAVIGLLSCIGFVVYSKKNVETKQQSQASKTVQLSAPDETPTKYSSTENWEDIPLSSSDHKRMQDIQQMQFKMLSYKQKYGAYPANASEAQMAQDRNPLVDPDTNQPYTFVDTTPEIGEMQYKLSATCDGANRNFEALDSKNIYGFMVQLSEGSYICKSNIR